MPSPFPGMDPYLEDPATWPNLHLNLIAEIQAVLNGQLRPKYYARAEERVYVSDQDDPGRRVLVPDVRIMARDNDRTEPWRPPDDLAGVAVAEPVVATTLIEDEIHEPRVEIIDAEGRRVVAVIEVLSPSNKVRGSRGQKSYRRKRTEVLTSSTHWVEVDLLREGETLVAGEVLPKGDYFVHMSRVEKRPSGLIWPIRLPQRLPVILVPLNPEDADATLDLHQIFNTVYDRSSYDLEVDYARNPIPPLPAHYLEWADQLLRARGLRH